MKCPTNIRLLIEEIALVQEIENATKNTDSHQEPSKIIHRALLEGLYARKERLNQYRITRRMLGK